jgi:Cu(I)/Ag(I) efflux system membrane fusion protein
VLVQVGVGRFEPREVELGARGENFVEVRRGLRDGEQVVVAANFLIDAEANLKAVVGGAAASPGPAAASQAARAPAAAASSHSGH